MRIIVCLLFLAFGTLELQSQNLWSDLPENFSVSSTSMTLIQPDVYRSVQLNLPLLRNTLSTAPLQTDRIQSGEGILVDFPTPDGGFETFRVVEAPVMEAPLQRSYPDIRSYAGVSIQHPDRYARFGYSQKGFHAMVLASGGQTYFIDALTNNSSEYYQVYFRKDYTNNPHDFTCQVDGSHDLGVGAIDVESLPEVAGDCRLRTYRLALACTGEYAAFHGGTVASVLAEYNVAMARVNGVYEKDLGIRMVLIANTNLLIYLNATSDPYTNNNGGTMLGQNQTNIDNIIGTANYDIGHVFSTGGGGIAGLGVPCRAGNKARGVTGLTSPVGDPFYIDYVAHEMGHQFGGNHTFNNSCGGNRAGGTAMEPGSGNTIMGYAGICAPNSQNFSDEHFHAISIQEITNYSQIGSGSTCPTVINVPNNPPVIAFNYTIGGSIPKSTPFFLDAKGTTDADGNVMSFCWEQMDNEIGTMPPVATNLIGPMFKSNDPVASTIRFFPDYTTVMNGGLSNTWEVLPSVARMMDFRCTVRDNNMGLGCTDEVDVSLNVSGTAGPFAITSPNTAGTFLVGNTTTLTWDVAGTNASPVNCTNVDVWIATSTGTFFAAQVAQNIPNNGSAVITIPNFITTKGRFMIVCSNNVFYDVSNQDIIIQLPPTPTFLVSSDVNEIFLCQNATDGFELTFSGIAGFNQPVNLSVTGLPSGSTGTFSSPTVTPTGMVTLTVQSGTAPQGVYPITVTATSGTITRTTNLTVHLLGGVPAIPSLSLPANGTQGLDFPIALNWGVTAAAQNYQIEISTNPSFSSPIISTTVDTNYFQMPQGSSSTVYYWRVKPSNLCGQGSNSSVWAFQSSAVFCQSFTPTDVPVTIPTTQGVVASSIQVPNTFTLIDVNVYAEITHAYVGDMVVSVRNPQGTTRRLMDRPGFPASNFGCDGQNIAVTFDDQASSTATELENTCNSNPAISGTYQPNQTLDVYNSLMSNGQWSLIVADNVADDGGAITGWILELCGEAAAPINPLLVTNNTLTVPFGQTADIANTFLQAQLAGTSNDNIRFVLLSLPQQGQVRLNGTALAIGQSFTMMDIMNGVVIYAHTSGMGMTDNFRFDIIGNLGGWLSNQTFNINIVNNSLSGNAVLTTAINCFNGNNGVITANPQGGTAPLQYSLNNAPFQASAVFTGLSAGSYTIRVRDANGFIFTMNAVTLSNPAQLSISASTSANVITAVGAGGTGALMYSINGIDFQSSNVFGGLSNGTYTVTIKDANGCTRTTTAIVSIGALTGSATIIDGISCFNAADAEIQANAGGGIAPYTYSLNNGMFQSSNIFTNVGAGTFSIQIRDSQGTIITTNALSLTNPAALTGTASPTGYNITVNASGGTGALMYSLNNGAFQSSNMYSGLPNGNYMIVIRDANGCTFTVSATINVAVLSGSSMMQQGVSCFGGANGSIVATVNGGVAPYMYRLNNGALQSSNVFGGLSAGTYTVGIVDAGGVSITTNAVALMNPPQIVSVSTPANNQISVAAMGGTGALTYTLNGGMAQSSPIFNGITTGNYTIVVTDTRGCSVTNIINVVGVDGVNFDLANVSCDGQEVITITAVGGTAPLMYSIDGTTFQTSNIFTITGSTNISPTVRDANGFSFIGNQVNIAVPTVLGGTATSSGSSITVNGTGGTSPYMYSINGGTFQVSNVFTNQANGDYDVTVQDAVGCTFIVPVTVMLIPLSASTAIVSQPLCHNGTSGSFAVCVDGGTAPFTYNFTPNVGTIGNTTGACAANVLLSGVQAGQNYVVTVTDVNGASIVSTIAIPNPPIITFTSTFVNGTLTINAQGGTGALSYSVNNGTTFSSSNTFENLPAGEIFVVIRDANGCTINGIVLISNIEDIVLAAGIELMPNPAQDFVQLRFTEAGLALRDIQVYSINGQQLISMPSIPAFAKIVDIQTASLPAGVYQVVVQEGTRMASKRLVVIR